VYKRQQLGLTFTWNWISFGVEEDVEGDAEVAKLLDVEQRRQDRLADLKKISALIFNFFETNLVGVLNKKDFKFNS